MALPLVLGAVIVGSLLKKDKMKQEVQNNLSLSLNSDFAVSLKSRSNFEVFALNELTINYDNVKIKGNLNIEQSISTIATWDFKQEQKVSNEVVQTIQAEIRNQMEQANLKFDNTFSKFFEGLGKSTDIDQKLVNKFNQSLNTSVNIETVSEIFFNICNTNTLTLNVSNTIIDGNVSINQNIVIDAVLRTLLNTTIDNFVSSDTSISLQNELKQIQKQTTISSIAVILIALAIVIAIAGAVSLAIRSLSNRKQTSLYNEQVKRLMAEEAKKQLAEKGIDPKDVVVKTDGSVVKKPSLMQNISNLSSKISSSKLPTGPALSKASSTISSALKKL